MCDYFLGTQQTPVGNTELLNALGPHAAQRPVQGRLCRHLITTGGPQSAFGLTPGGAPSVDLTNVTCTVSASCYLIEHGHFHCPKSLSSTWSPSCSGPDPWTSRGLPNFACPRMSRSGGHTAAALRRAPWTYQCAREGPPRPRTAWQRTCPQRRMTFPCGCASSPSPC